MNDLLALALAGASATCLVGAFWGPLFAGRSVHESLCLAAGGVILFFHSMEMWVW